MKLDFKNLFKSEDSKFLLACGFKFSGIYLALAIFVYYSMWIIVSLNSIYFEAGISKYNLEMRESFFLSVFSFVISYLPEIMLFYVFLFFSGIYIGKVLLRPFQIIGYYCQARTLGKAVDYNPDYFTDYKLLSRFSEYFFVYLEQCLKDKNIRPNQIPSQFSKIHAPNFERVFFFHFLLIILILAMICGFFIGYLALDIHDQIIKISLQTFSNIDSNIVYFLESQKSVYSKVVMASSLILFLSYLLLSFHLYGKISGAIFGFFATMRAYMKGNIKARVHLIGYAHIRPYSRYMNKFLDHVERQCLIDHNKGQIKK